MKTFCSFLLLIACSGCWTLSETERPTALATPAGESTKPVLLVGFKTTNYAYSIYHGYRGVYVQGYHTRHHCEYGHYEYVPSVEYVPVVTESDAFLHYVTDLFERAGYTIGQESAARQIEVTFDGPHTSSADDWEAVAWNLLTLFICDHRSTAWSAQLRIRDAKSGKLLYSRDYLQPHDVTTMGLIPLFGASSHEHLSSSYAQSWCLTTLTEQIVRDATEYLATER